MGMSIHMSLRGLGKYGMKQVLKTTILYENQK